MVENAGGCVPIIAREKRSRQMWERQKNAASRTLPGMPLLSVGNGLPGLSLNAKNLHGELEIDRVLDCGQPGVIAA